MKTLKFNLAFVAILVGSALAVGATAKTTVVPGLYQSDSLGQPTGPKLGDNAREENCTAGLEINCVAEYDENGTVVGDITQGTFHN